MGNARPTIGSNWRSSFATVLKRQYKLSFYIESDGGDRKAGILFDDVEAYKYTHMTARSIEMINAAYDN